MSKRFYPPRFDYVFKRIFGDKRNIHILAAFLMAALSLPEEDFDHLTILDPHLKRDFNDDKMGILDVKLYLRHGVTISIEIQVAISRDLRKRIAFSTAKMLAEQLKRGEEHRQVKRAVSIVICGGVLLSEETGYYNTYSIRNVRSGLEFTDVLQINILEPSKLPEEPDGAPLFKWGQFFKAETPEELAMAAKTDPAIREAVAQVMELNEDERERMLADARWRWQMDQAALRRDSYDDGKREAEAKYQPIIGEKDRAIEDLRRKLREAGIDA
jgi:predicted transposase/invertase (TIGR01784 family)